MVICTVISMKPGIIYNYIGGFSFNAEDMVAVLKKLREAVGSKSKICLFWDNARYHKTAAV